MARNTNSTFPDVDQEANRIARDPRMVRIGESAALAEDISQEATDFARSALDLGVIAARKSYPIAAGRAAEIFSRKGCPEDHIAQMVHDNRLDASHPLVREADERRKISNEKIFSQGNTTEEDVFARIDKSQATRGLTLVNRVRYASLRMGGDTQTMQKHFIAFSTQLNDKNDPAGRDFAKAAFACHDVAQHRAWREDPRSCTDPRFASVPADRPEVAELRKSRRQNQDER